MKKILKNKNFLLLIMMFFLFLLSSFYLIKLILMINNIENTLRYLVVGILVLIFTLGLLKVLKVIIKNQKKKSIILSIILLLFFVVECIAYNTINKVYTSIDNISRDETKYSSSLITLKNKITNLDQLKNKKIGIYDDISSVDSYIIPNEIINDKKLNIDNEIVKYDNIFLMINALYDEEVDAIFLNSNYATLFSFNGFSDLKNETSILLSKEKIVKINKNSNSKIDKPFTILLMGVDSTNDSIKDGSAINGDALLLITFNPKTLNSTILSIPRDTYVPIACFKNKRENKITHAASYGQDCMIETIENFTGIDINYYAKINFIGLVKLVDTLGGIYVDVPYSFCEQNSKRLWGKDTVFVKEGYQKINGEQALALSRNRHIPKDGSDSGKEMAIYCPTYNKGIRSDFVRGENQQKIISGIINQLKNIKGINDIYSLLDLISNSLETDISTNQILSLYNIGKELLINNENATVSFDRLVLKGIDRLIWDESLGIKLYNFYYNRDSLKDIVEAMNINLENIEPEIIKEIHFSINNPYEKISIGSGPYSKTYDINLVPSFINKTADYVTNWGKKNNIKVTIKYVEVSDINSNDIVISQNIPETFIVKDIKKDLIVEVGKYTPKELEESSEELEEIQN